MQHGENNWALIDSRQQLSRYEVSSLLPRIAGRVAAAVDSDHRFTICAGNSAEHIMLMAAGLAAGRSSVPVSAMLAADEIEYALRDSHSTTLFVGPESLEAGLRAAEMAQVDTVVGWRCEPRPGLVDWSTWLKGPTIDVDPGTPAAPQLHYTSGTTGRPKGTLTPPALLPAQGSIGEMLAALRAGVHDLPGPAIIVGPLNHTGPLSSFRQFVGGRQLVVMDRFDAEEFLQLVARHKAAAAVMVPTHFQRLFALPAETRRRYDVTSLREITHTGSSCPTDVKYAMIDWFGPILKEGYGATEVGATNYISSAEWIAKPGSVGRTLPPFEPMILDEEDRPTPVGQDGRIFFKDTSGRGIIYPNDPDQTRAAHLAPGIFTLGDRGHLDEDGYLFVTGRASDMVISGGINIYPAEIERVLSSHPDVEDVGAIGIPHADLGEQLIAVIVPRDPDDPPAAQALKSYAAARLARYKLPRAFHFVASLGRTDMGKLNKAQLAKALDLS